MDMHCIMRPQVCSRGYGYALHHAASGREGGEVEYHCLKFGGNGLLAVLRWGGCGGCGGYWKISSHVLSGRCGDMGSLVV